jgi:tRNA dimethylallyltransferase
LHESPFHRAIYLTGPTASGKTAVGIALARRLDAEIIALDSATLYRAMDIGTGKPTMTERGSIPHHLIDVIDPWESASVSDYRAWAERAVCEIENRGKRALFVGGTALYLKILLRGLFRGPGADAGLRARLDREADALGEQSLHDRLAVLDPRSAARLHPNDRRRVIRALEVIELAGRPLSVLQSQHDRPGPPGVPVLALDVPRACLNDRINRRVHGFFQDGLIDEVVRLQAGIRPLSPAAISAIGYREVIAMLGGSQTLDQTVEQVQTRTRQFAKRQGTWFRGLQEVRSVAVAPDETSETTAERLAALIGAGFFQDSAS